MTEKKRIRSLGDLMKEKKAKDEREALEEFGTEKMADIIRRADRAMNIGIVALIISIGLLIYNLWTFFTFISPILDLLSQ